MCYCYTPCTSKYSYVEDMPFDIYVKSSKLNGKTCSLCSGSYHYNVTILYTHVYIYKNPSLILIFAWETLIIMLLFCCVSSSLKVTALILKDRHLKHYETYEVCCPLSVDELSSNICFYFLPLPW